MHTPKSASVRKGYLWLLAVPLGLLALLPFLSVAGLGPRAGLAVFMPALVVLAGVFSGAQALAQRVELSLVQVKGVQFPLRLRMGHRHTWARRAAAGRVRTGVDDLTQLALGPVDAVEPAKVGDRVEVGEVVAVLWHGGRSIAARAPVAGTVARVNRQLAGDPGMVNRAPYGHGWLVELHPSAPTLAVAFQDLMRGEQARAWLSREIDRLVAAASPRTLPLTMADGGELVGDLSDLDDATWNAVRDELFA
ncbi:MAG: hypothetical protein HY908_15010 [Myxococcales bacterium]|nr:hypothetical protein [Myxococcales bacterium]